MSWGKVESKMKREIEDLRQAISDYSYEGKKSGETDKNVRGLFDKKIRQIKEDLTRIMELAYRDEESGLTKSLQSARDEADLFLNEVEALGHFRVAESREALEKLVECDWHLLKNLERIEAFVKDLHSNILNSRTEGLESNMESVKSSIEKCRDIFKQRLDAVKGG